MAAKSRSKRNKAIDAMIALAADDPWQEVTLSRIAARAGLPMADLRAAFSSRAALVLAYFDRIDAAMLEACAAQENGDTTEPARDRIFDCLMLRFEAMESDKPALRSIMKGVAGDPALAACLGLRLAQTQRWVLEAAGINPGSGADKFMKVQGLACVYAKVFRVWLNEDSSQMPRTMAALDRHLRSGERWLCRLRGPVSVFGGLLKVACAVPRQCCKSRSQAPGDPDPVEA